MRSRLCRHSYFSRMDLRLVTADGDFSLLFLLIFRCLTVEKSSRMGRL